MITVTRKYVGVRVTYLYSANYMIHAGNGFNKVLTAEIEHFIMVPVFKFQKSGNFLQQN